MNAIEVNFDKKMPYGIYTSKILNIVSHAVFSLLHFSCNKQNKNRQNPDLHMLRDLFHFVAYGVKAKHFVGYNVFFQDLLTEVVCCAVGGCTNQDFGVLS